MSHMKDIMIDKMNNEQDFEKLQDEILNVFYTSSAVNDTIWFDEWTTLYEEIMMIISTYIEGG